MTSVCKRASKNILSDALQFITKSYFFKRTTIKSCIANGGSSRDTKFAIYLTTSGKGILSYFFGVF